MPDPVSDTSTAASPLSDNTVNRTRPSSGVWRRALSSKLRTARATSASLPIIGAGSASNKIGGCEEANRRASSRHRSDKSNGSGWNPPDSNRDRSSRWAIIRDKRTELSKMRPVKSRTASGSSSKAIKTVSAAAWMAAAGVFNSWEAAVTKSRFMVSARRRSVMSSTAATCRPSDSEGWAVT